MFAIAILFVGCVVIVPPAVFVAVLMNGSLKQALTRYVAEECTARFPPDLTVIQGGKTGNVRAGRRGE